MSLVVALSDSLLSAHKTFGMHLLQLQDQGEHFHACLCVASGCSLMQPWDLREQDPVSAVSIALRALESGNPVIKRHIADNPRVRVVVVNSRSSIPYCRKTGEEEFPQFVGHRKRSKLISKLETRWTLCDLDDVVAQRDERRRFDVLEDCRLRHEKGMFSETDYYHLRRDIGKRGAGEIIKAMRRTALERDGDCVEEGDIVLVLAAGWNVSDCTYAKLDNFGKAWLRADLVASAELCALNGHPVSAFMKKLRDLAGRRRGSHWRFLKQSIASMKPVRLPIQLQQQMDKKRKRTASSASTLVGFVGGKRRKRDDTQTFPFAGKYIGNWYGMDQAVVIYQDWTYTVPGYVDYGRVTKSNAPVAATYCFRRSDKSGSKAHYFRFTGLRAYGDYELSQMPAQGSALWTLMKAEE